MISFSELKRCIAILDAPRGLTPDDVRQWRQEALRESSYAALYYPWICVGAESPDAQLVPPCGHVAGAYMRASEIRGAHSAPANESLTAATDLESRITQPALEGPVRVVPAAAQIARCMNRRREIAFIRAQLSIMSLPWLAVAGSCSAASLIVGMSTEVPNVPRF